MYQNASNGIKKIFLTQILGIIAVVLACIPFLGILGVIASIIGLVLTLVGLKEAAADSPGYQTAFIIAIINLIVTCLAFISGVFGSIMSIVATILSLATLYYVCHTTADLLRSTGENDIAADGISVWNLNLICTAVAVICSILGLLPFLKGLVTIISVIVAIVSIIATIKYISFLNNSASALGN